MKIYTYHEWGSKPLALYTCEVKETPSGYKATGERPGLAFGCRCRWRKDSVNTSEEGARTAMLVLLKTTILQAEGTIAQAEQDIEALEAQTYKTKVSK